MLSVGHDAREDIALNDLVEDELDVAGVDHDFAEDSDERFAVFKVVQDVVVKIFVHKTDILFNLHVLNEVVQDLEDAALKVLETSAILLGQFLYEALLIAELAAFVILLKKCE